MQVKSDFVQSETRLKEIGKVYDIGSVKSPEEFKEILQVLLEQRRIRKNDIVVARHNQWKISNLSPEVILIG